MMTTNILRDLYFIKTPYTDSRAPYPWKTAFRINDPRYKYIEETYKKQIGDTNIKQYRIIRFLSLKYNISFDYVLIPTTTWHYFKADVIRNLCEKGYDDIIDVKFSYDNMRPPICEILDPYVIIADGVFVHLSIIKHKTKGWSY